MVGYGQVLLYNLILRSLLVALGTTLTIIAARKATSVFISPPTSNIESPPELGEVDLENPSEEPGEAGSESKGETGVETPEAGPSEEASSEIDDDADIGKLADMVSETMKEEDET